MKFYCCRCIADKQGWNGPNLLNLEYLLRFARCMSGKISSHHQQHTDTNASWQKKCRWRTILRAMSTPNYIHPVLSLRAHFGPFTASVFWRPIRVCLLDLSILLYKRKVCNLWIFYCYFLAVAFIVLKKMCYAYSCFLNICIPSNYIVHPTLSYQKLCYHQLR